MDGIQVREDSTLTWRDECAHHRPAWGLLRYAVVLLGLGFFHVALEPTWAATEIATGSMLGPRYKQTAFYTPEAEGGIAWNDPEVGIAWPQSNPILSGRDRSQQSLAEYRRRPAFA